VICPQCGSDITGGAEFCPQCGEPSPDPSGRSETPRAEAAPVPRVVYGGFWRRAAAYIFDVLLLGLVLDPVILQPLIARNGISPDDFYSLAGGHTRQIIAIQLLFGFVAWVYWALLESSPWRATLGKKLFGMEVTDLYGRRISFARATGRHFAKNISLLMFGIGFLMAGFTDKKQAFHDILAGCLVVRKSYRTDAT
jgi:uncharacterized RDD family membrane protein YckC